ncbi:RNA polymerase II transcription factor B subunit 4 [Striga asiatica]|uniref:RNA polymerase II transcription factor B subunit 4 n=1 Tax=Striga asiatica TaxID=4170 RepID=A0A5A7QYA6_STRAF|nr:RNA polymerase II transcription factor B subunit 4 [Striga asiatica]
MYIVFVASKLASQLIIFGVDIHCRPSQTKFSGLKRFLRRLNSFEDNDGGHGSGAGRLHDGQHNQLEQPANGLTVVSVADLLCQLEYASRARRRHSNPTTTTLHLRVLILTRLIRCGPATTTADVFEECGVYGLIVSTTKMDGEFLRE